MASFFQNTPRRGRTLPESSIFYRTVRDVPVGVQNATWKQWCRDNWAQIDLGVTPFNTVDYNYMVANASDQYVRRPSYFLDEPQIPLPLDRLVLTKTPTSLHPVAYSNPDNNIFLIDRRGYMRLTEVSRWRAEGGEPGNNFRPGYGDSHYTTVWPTRRVTQEAWLFDSVLDNCADGFTERSFDTNAFANYTSDGPAGSVAAKMPIVPLVITADECKRGWIGHTLAWVVRNGAAKNTAIWPGRASDGASTDVNAPPYGTFWRLRPDFDVSALHPQMQVVARALQDYGAILMDRQGGTGGGGGIICASDAQWADTVGSFTSTLEDYDILDMRPYAVAPTTSYQCTPPGA